MLTSEPVCGDMVVVMFGDRSARWGKRMERRGDVI